MYLGVDPGLKGALAVYDPAQNLVLSAQNIPILTLQRNSKTKNAVDVHRVVSIVKELATLYPGLTAHLELVGPMPKQGVSSVWSFSRTDTAVEVALIAAGVPVTRVPPQIWKKALGCTADKDQALLRASQLMPANANNWAPVRLERDKEDCKGLAEAALIAYYAAHKKVA